MATLPAQIDRFVRWFFNSSPESTAITPRSSGQPPAAAAPSRRSGVPVGTARRHSYR